MQFSDELQMLLKCWSKLCDPGCRIPELTSAQKLHINLNVTKMMALLTLNFALTLGKHFSVRIAYFSTISYYLK